MTIMTAYTFLFFVKSLKLLAIYSECKNCPNMEKFSDLVLGILKQNNILQVIFSMWQSTDRCTLKQECLLLEDFVCDALAVTSDGFF